MRTPLIIAFVALVAGACPAAARAQTGMDASRLDDGAFDDRGVDRHDRTPDRNYRRGESEGRGAYYDGGRYGPRGTGGSGGALDPWLSGTSEGQRFVRARMDSGANGRVRKAAARRANDWFRGYADADGDRRLTDVEITIALVSVERFAKN